MSFFRCSIFRDDGSVCVEGVTVALDHTEPAGTADWFGTIAASEGMDLVAGRRYRIVLTDGRAGDFMVRRNTSAGGQDRAVAIQGMGPLS